MYYHRQPMYYHNFVCIVFEYFNLPALDSYKKFSFQYTKNFLDYKLYCPPKGVFLQNDLLDFQSLYITFVGT